jgi:hypothetical protein
LNDKSDVYSFVVVLLELISGKPAVDSQRGVDDASLVNFAKSLIESGDLEALVDRSLLEVYNDPGGNGREYLLNFGRLALRCSDMQSKERPGMKDVLTELRILMCQLRGESEELSFSSEDQSEYSLSSGIDASAAVLRRYSSSVLLQSAQTGAEMCNVSFPQIFQYSSQDDDNVL